MRTRTPMDFVHEHPVTRHRTAHGEIHLTPYVPSLKTQPNNAPQYEWNNATGQNQSCSGKN